MIKDRIIKYLPYVIIVAMALFWFDSCQRKDAAMNRLETNLKISRDSTKHFVDKSGQLVSQNAALVLTNNELKDQFELLGIDRKRLEDQVGNLKHLVNYYKGQLVAQGSAVIKGRDTVLVYVDSKGDTIKRRKKSFLWTNKYLSLDEIYDPATDSLSLLYSYVIDFELTTYYKRQGLFKPNQIVTDIRLSDPSARMMSGQSIVIAPPPKHIWERNWFWGAAGFVLAKLIFH